MKRNEKEILQRRSTSKRSDCIDKGSIATAMSNQKVVRPLVLDKNQKGKSMEKSTYHTDTTKILLGHISYDDGNVNT
ncbi:hypothetical protein Syun_019185 [Stephania yunnanensis]|uniref:Uncharacterized protein n=1 Tax=Stephania yunnanensis TaxID=152371 RepID=A0AAP0NWF9_9MAGN